MAWPLLIIQQAALDHVEDFWTPFTEGIATKPPVPRTETRSRIQAADHSALALVCSQAVWWFQALPAAAGMPEGTESSPAATMGCSAPVMLRAREEQCEREQAVS